MTTIKFKCIVPASSLSFGGGRYLQLAVLSLNALIVMDLDKGVVYTK